MESVSSYASRRWVLPIVALIIGVAVGTFYAWVINPVEWVDGEPAQLRSDLQEDYLRMAIDSYSVNRDADLALVRFESMGDIKSVTLVSVAEDPQEVSPTAIQSFRAVIEIDEQSASQTDSVQGGLLGQASGLLVPICGATLALGLLLAAALFLRSRNREDEQTVAPAGAMPLGESAQQPEMPGEGVPAAAAPLQIEPEPVSDDSLATFRTIYSLGDDDYDDSFSIESPTGDFLGECGVGIGDLIGAGEPNKVAAFEVWLFDKNDIQTVTKVLMSSYAHQDAETRSRLSAKGDPIVAEPGGVISLQTASLEVEARIVDMTYGESALPGQSFFERLTIEIRAWSRDAVG